MTMLKCFDTPAIGSAVSEQPGPDTTQSMQSLLHWLSAYSNTFLIHMPLITCNVIHYYHTHIITGKRKRSKGLKGVPYIVLHWKHILALRIQIRHMNDNLFIVHVLIEVRILTSLVFDQTIQFHSTKPSSTKTSD